MSSPPLVPVSSDALAALRKAAPGLTTLPFLLPFVIGTIPVTDAQAATLVARGWYSVGLVAVPATQTGVKFTAGQRGATVTPFCSLAVCRIYVPSRDSAPEPGFTVTLTNQPRRTSRATDPLSVVQIIQNAGALLAGASQATAPFPTFELNPGETLYVATDALATAALFAFVWSEP